MWNNDKSQTAKLNWNERLLGTPKPSLDAGLETVKSKTYLNTAEIIWKISGLNEIWLKGF